MEFIPLASSSEGCCYLVRCGSQPPLLLDAGVPPNKIMPRIGFQLSSLAGCLITHAHGDHCAYARQLMDRAVDCYASQETCKFIGKGDEPHRWHRLRAVVPQDPFAIGPWSVLPFEAVHDVNGTLGFVIGIEDKKLLYLTDTAYSRYRFDGLTHIAVEANFGEAIMRDNKRSGDVHRDRYRRTFQNHMSIERVVEMLKANDLSKVEEIWLLHLSDLNSDEREFKEVVQAATGCPVYVAQKRGVA